MIQRDIALIEAFVEKVTYGKRKDGLSDNRGKYFPVFYGYKKIVFI